MLKKIHPPFGQETVLWALSFFWVFAVNRPFFAASLQGHSMQTLDTWGFTLGLAILLLTLHFF